MKKVPITRIDISSGQVQKTTDFVSQEKPLHIFLNRTHFVTIFCSPSDLKELAVGHVLSVGIVESLDEIERVDLDGKGICRIKLVQSVDLEKRLKLSKHFSRVIFSACGSKMPYQPSAKLPKIKSSLTVNAQLVMNCVNQLNFKAGEFRETGGVHAAAIYSGDGRLVAFAEDVGRHNAVDKAVGMTSLSKIEFDKCFLVLTGRLTGDISVKAARVGLPIVASLAAAIDSGIVVARDTGLTLVGFVRGNRMNIYTFPERILLN